MRKKDKKIRSTKYPQELTDEFPLLKLDDEGLKQLVNLIHETVREKRGDQMGQKGKNRGSE